VICGTFRRGCLAALAVSLSTLVWGATASAATLACGATIVQSTVLGNDLLGCYGVGLRIGAPNVKLDLNGHTVSGSGNGLVGIDIAGQANAVVEDGVVSGFVTGVRATRADAAIIRRMTVAASGGAIIVDGGKGGRVLDSKVSGGVKGIEIHEASSARVRRNTVTGGFDGGIVVVDAVGSQVEENTVSGARVAGIVVATAATGSRSSKVLNNVTTGAVFDGILVDYGSSGTLVKGNRTSANGYDGIHVLHPATTVGGNVATANGDDGIDAIPGTIDGGRNVASGNADRQCVGVACSA
jgi:parallel beta-helix repeat protein